jgi:Mor family transcriptional regulator
VILVAQSVEAALKRFMSHDVSNATDQQLAFESAVEAAVSVVVSLKGDVNIWVPSESALLRWVRDGEIYNAFTGDNFEELAALFGLHTGSVRRAISRHSQRIGVAK